jgi:UDP-N-acetyl-D-glucosamine dehydrogenase
MHTLTDVSKQSAFTALQQAIMDRTAKAGVIGLGYVGLPLAAAIARANFVTVGFDIDPAKVQLINAGTSYIDAVAGADLAELTKNQRLSASADFAGLAACDVIIICVPTPLTRHREPDLSYIERTARTIGQHLRRGQVVILESTTFPGTTSEFVKPILENDGLQSGNDFFLGFSPEREDPGNARYHTHTIPKVVSGEGPEAKALVESFYRAVVHTVVPVSSPAVAEAVKITENVFRAVNIALVNELKIIYDAMGIDVWEVIEAAASKPFGYMPFYPGPGLGGHCIPIDPFYLTWKAKEYEISTRFIELAGEINVAMPFYVIGKLERALDDRFKKSISSARILLLGLAYKKNVADTRESPSLKIMDLLEKRGAQVDFYDSHVPVIPVTREHSDLSGRLSVVVDEKAIKSYDAVLLLTDHDEIAYELFSKHACLIVDTRNAFARRSLGGDNILKA